MPDPKYPYMALEDWKAKAIQGEAPVEVTLCKTIPDAITKQAGAEDRQLRVVISDNGMDRSRDVISVEGWELDMYRLNPVILFAHDYSSLPIGVSDATFAEGEQLISLASFAPPEVSTFADMVYQLMTHPKRFLRASSVGFRPLEFTLDQERRGINFLRSELVEFSIVPVPDNPRALSEARSLGIDLTPLKAWAEAVLDQYPYTDGEGGPGVWVPKSQLERAWFTLQDDQLISLPAGDIQLKRGRVLSAKNETAVRDAVSAIENATARLQTLLDALPQPTDAEAEAIEEEALPAAAVKDLPATQDLDGEYVELADEPDEGLIDINPDELAALIREELRAKLMAVTGRLD